MLFVSEAVVVKSWLIAGPAAMLGAGGCSNTGLAATSVAADPFCAWRLPGRGAPARPLTSLVRLRASWGALEQSAPLSRGGSVPVRQVGFVLPPLLCAGSCRAADTRHALGHTEELGMACRDGVPFSRLSQACIGNLP